MESNNQQTSTFPPSFQTLAPHDFSSYGSYYQEEFSKISNSNETFKGKWNWYAFIFSWLWLFSKGCWGMALIILGTLILTMGGKLAVILGIIWAIQCGRRGTWIYYNVKIKNKQITKSL